ncbi:hypothetical protein [Pricia antarctica]|uniref:hypothetical protein n=1 Tax=Pricia antarctica TaxID=641691 RepID=UPI000B88AEF9|nr:hypothetical protein [Pricia antarctica]
MKQWGLNEGDKTADELEEIVVGNVQLYDDYQRGNVFGYTITTHMGTFWIVVVVIMVIWAKWIWSRKPNLLSIMK